MSGRFAGIYGGSLVMHAALALSVGTIEPKVERREPTKIVIKEVKRPKPEKAPEPPPPPPPPPPQAAPAPAKPKPQAKPAQPPKAAPPAAAASSAAVAAPSFGLTLGASSGGGGIAVAAAPAPAAPSEVQKTLTPRTLVKPKETTNACSEALIKPKPIEIKQPSYTGQAREAGISGKVRVELRLDASGHVVSARVLEGLGHGLDEAALEAARASRFEPATLCGVAAETSFVIGIRFNL